MTVLLEYLNICSSIVFKINEGFSPFSEFSNYTVLTKFHIKQSLCASPVADLEGFLGFRPKPSFEIIGNLLKF